MLVLPLELMDQFECFEFLAHHLVYNAEKPGMDKPFTLPHSESQFQIHLPHINIPAGIKVYFVLPLSVADNDIKVLFRGTKDEASLLRDLEHNAPGAETFAAARFAIFTAFCKVLAKMADHHREVSVTICGHSLGGADAQMFFARLINRMLDWHNQSDAAEHEITQYRFIKTVRLAIFNSAGIARSVADNFIADARELLHLVPDLRLTGYCLHSAGDVVQQTGDGHILAKIPKEVMQVHVIKAYHKKQKEDSWINHIYFREFDKAFIYFKQAHVTHFFPADQRPLHEFEYYNNIQAAGIVDSKLLRKSPMLQTYFVSSFRRLIYWALMAHSWMGAEDNTIRDDQINELIDDEEMWISIQRETKDFISQIEVKKWTISEEFMNVFKKEADRLRQEGKLWHEYAVNSGALISLQQDHDRLRKLFNQYLEYLRSQEKRRPLLPAKIELLETEVNRVNAHSAEPRQKKSSPLHAITKTATPPPVLGLFLPRLRPRITWQIPIQAVQTINAYIYSRTDLSQKKLNLVTRLFRDVELTEKKLALAKKTRACLATTGQQKLTVITLIKSFMEENNELEKQKKHEWGKSGLAECLKDIENILLTPTTEERMRRPLQPR